MSSNETVDAQPFSCAEASINQAKNGTISLVTQSLQSKNQVANEDVVDWSTTDVPTDNDFLFSPYNMNHTMRGDAVIFHHTKFDPNLELEERRGDEDLIKRLGDILADGLEFSVKVHRDLKYKKIEEEIKKLAEKDHKNSDCILIVFVTHGSNSKLYARDTHYNPDILQSHFTTDKCPTLAGKPKIFIIQACRGDLVNTGTCFARCPIPRSMSTIETDGPKTRYKMPAHADFLVVNSTVSRYTSYRTWFMEALCDVLDLETDRNNDFLSILTTVQRKVAISYKDELGHKQIPSLITQLTRRIYFTQKEKKNPAHSDYFYKPNCRIV